MKLLHYPTSMCWHVFIIVVIWSFSNFHTTSYDMCTKFGFYLCLFFSSWHISKDFYIVLFWTLIF